ASPCAARTPAGRTRIAIPRASHRTAGGSRPRSTGRRRAQRRGSRQPPLVGPRRVRGEALGGLPAVQVAAQHPLDVVDGAIGLDLEPAELAAEGGLGAEMPAQVHLVDLDVLAVGAARDRALEPDVGDLEPGARVGAAVDRDAHRLGEVRQPPLQLAVELLRPGLGLDDRQLAELDAGAGQRALPERARVHRQVVGGKLGDQRVRAVPGDVQDDQLLLGGGPDAPPAVLVGQAGDPRQLGARGAAHPHREADCVAAVGLLGQPGVPAGPGVPLRLRSVRQRRVQVVLLQHLPEPLGAPVGEQELQPRVLAGPAVAVVAEDPGDPGPHLGDPVRLDERAEPLAELRVRGQAAADPQVESGPAVRPDHADERHVVDLVVGAVVRAAGDRRLVLAGQVGELGVADVAVAHLAQRRRRVQHLVLRHAGQRAAEDDPRGVAAGLGGVQADRLQPAPDLRDVLDPDPVQLDVLPVGDVLDVPAELCRDGRDRQQLLAAQRPAVDPYAEHEEAVLELLRVEPRGAAARDARRTLGVEPEPAEPATQVGGIDAVEPGVLVAVDDPLPGVEAVVVALDPFVLVQRLAVAEGPLALAALGRHGRLVLPGAGGAASGTPQGLSSALTDRAVDPAEVDVATRHQEHGDQAPAASHATTVAHLVAHGHRAVTGIMARWASTPCCWTSAAAGPSWSAAVRSRCAAPAGCWRPARP